MDLWYLTMTRAGPPGGLAHEPPDVRSSRRPGAGHAAGDRPGWRAQKAGEGLVGTRAVRGLCTAPGEPPAHRRRPLGVEVRRIHRRTVGPHARPARPLVRPRHQPPDRPWRRALARVRPSGA